MKKIGNAVMFLLFAYPVGVLIGLTFWLLRLVGVLKIRGWSNFPHWRQRVLVVSNHPSLVEPILLTGLFFHQYLLRPFKYSPWTLADRKNYYDRYPFLRPRLIPVDRTGVGDPRSLIVAKKVLASGANIIVFPEGGRTFKGSSFLKSESGRKKIRPLKAGFAVLAAEPGAILVPVWFEFNSWLSMRLTIGKSERFTGMQREEVVERTKEILLEIADQAS